MTTMTTTLINGVKLVQQNDMVVHASKEGKFEPETFSFIDKHFPQYGVFVDAGAYTGIFSLYCASNKQAICFAYEPNPAVYERLNTNIGINGHTRIIHAFPYALSNVNGHKALMSNPNTPLSSGGSFEKSTKQMSKGVKTTLMRYDDAPFAHENVNMVKVDVEGHELEVIKGMTQMIEQDHPIFIVECWDSEAVDKIDSFLSQFGYEISDKLDAQNYAFVLQ